METFVAEGLSSKLCLTTELTQDVALNFHMHEPILSCFHLVLYNISCRCGGL